MAKAPDDAISEEMADEAMKPEDENWETVKTGIGSGWDLTTDGPLIGVYLGATDVPLPDDPERDSATAYQFAHSPDGETVFLWESHELTSALDEIGVGEKVRVTFLKEESFTGKDGPRRVKRYKVERAVSK